MGMSSACAPHLGSHLLSRQLMPHPVGSTPCVQWQRHGGRLWYAWPQKTCHRHATRPLYLSWNLLEFKPTSGIFPLPSTLLNWNNCTWVMIAGSHEVTTCDLFGAPGVSALFSFILSPASFAEHEDDFHLLRNTELLRLEKTSMIKSSHQPSAHHPVHH